MEGVIRFKAVCLGPELPEGMSAHVMDAGMVRHHMIEAGWMGQDPARYGGDGFGNISIRCSDGNGFLISASQLGAIRTLDESHWCHIRKVSPRDNQVHYTGVRQPSSETLTHAAVYAAVPSTGCVVHVHAPEVWEARQHLGYPVSDPGVEYGTPDMYAEVLKRAPGAPAVLILGGHEDGVLVWGDTADSALTRLLELREQVTGDRRGVRI